MQTRAWYLVRTMTKAFTSVAYFLVNVHNNQSQAKALIYGGKHRNFQME